MSEMSLWCKTKKANIYGYLSLLVFEFNLVNAAAYSILLVAN